jgi:hypothetical protein
MPKSEEKEKTKSGTKIIVTLDHKATLTYKCQNIAIGQTIFNNIMAFFGLFSTYL